MKTTFLILPVLALTAAAASAQGYNPRTQRPAANTPAQGANASNSSGAEYAAVNVAPDSGGAFTQGTTRRAARQQARARRAEYAGVSVAPRR